ncbi:uncharacterized protein LOC122632721 [Vespula pensylvanica]|uniref:uncharacterized protein LOC122632721 n=1 Tax=Vespula pensylvanica TaxID=30213 RepID=UPI001CBA208D|nr:uncharacterized protein LOC122632721 [Vespula pensylvanica]
MRPKLYSIMVIHLLQTAIEVLLTKVGFDILKKISFAITPVEPISILAWCKEFVPAKMLLADSRPFSNGHVTTDEEYNFKRNTFRPRLISESSVDSEDNYEIVFETDSENIYDSDFDYNESTDESQNENESECEITQNEKTYNFQTRKVTFNLTPVVHTMVQWDYAYRAARKGPWEEMARDRERFKGRINCIRCILEPILQIQHRTHIWQERFA